MNSGGVVELTVAIRPVRPDDDERFRRLWPRLSRDTVHRRFHAPLRRIPAAAVRRLGEVDHDLREAVVAVVGGEVIGVARYDRSPADVTAADLAVVVEDGRQGVGASCCVTPVALAASTQHRGERAALRQELALRRIVVPAPTRESAHELASLFAHR